jgi:hypothetical protein
MAVLTLFVGVNTCIMNTCILFMKFLNVAKVNKNMYTYM